ncbi:hypothetical protein SDC9_122386 [bioreactor metagenome]|uniref:Uncharacterized protein n=1 Tax=bioreactor metagenome TaxID=1076179 RepID=A0A645CEP9_9ZZZZ
MTIVPEPQKGSINCLEPSNFVKRTKAAARVSFNGASPAFSLYPLLCNPTPEVSTERVTKSFRILTSILYTGPSSLNQDSLYFSFIFSTTAFFTMPWQSGTLCNWDLTDLPIICIFPSMGISSPQSTDLVPWNNSSKEVALNSAILIKTLSAVLR